MVEFVLILILAYYLAGIAKQKGKAHNKYWIVIPLIWGFFKVLTRAFPISYNSTGVMFPYLWRDIALYGSLLIIYLLIYFYLKKSPDSPELAKKIDELGKDLIEKEK